MTQSRYSVLVSLCLLLAIAGGFFFVAHKALNAVDSSVRKAIATATVVVLPPTPTRPRPTPTPKGLRPTEIPPTATSTGPAAGGQIVMSTSQNLSDARKTFPATTGRYFCLANLPSLPLSAGITWKWVHINGNTSDSLYDSPSFTYGSVLRYSYFDGPIGAGSYRCTVSTGGQIVGAVDFAVQ